MAYDGVLDEHILSLVRTQQIREQEDLQVLLKTHGFDVPQATLSRRLKKLKIAKIEGIYRVVEHSRSALPIIQRILVSEMGLIVMHTQPGQANSAAFFIDQKYVGAEAQEKESGILGTVAGDDTILVILRSQRDAPDVVSSLRKDFLCLDAE